MIYLDDAYNANPAGFANALDLMQVLRENDAARRILITPGVAELGEKHDAVHRELGAKAAATTDITVVVKPERIPTFVEGLKAAANPPEVVTFEQFSEARAWLDANARLETWCWSKMICRICSSARFRLRWKVNGASCNSATDFEPKRYRQRKRAGL